MWQQHQLGTGAGDGADQRGIRPIRSNHRCADLAQLTFGERELRRLGTDPDLQLGGRIIAVAKNADESDRAGAEELPELPESGELVDTASDGADGLIIEVHNDPEHALTDGAQSITPPMFSEMMASIRRIAAAVDREV